MVPKRTIKDIANLSLRKVRYNVVKINKIYTSRHFIQNT